MGDKEEKREGGVKFEFFVWKKIERKRREKDRRKAKRNPKEKQKENEIFESIMTTKKIQNSQQK